MRRIITLALLILVSFLLQTTLFHFFEFAGVVPNLLLILTMSFGLMRGRKEGLLVGFFCGLLADIMFGFAIGPYAMLYMYIGYVNGLFQKRFYPDDIKLPMLLIGGSDIIYNLFVYLVMFLLRSRFHFIYYLKAIIIPELVYTMVVSIFIYIALLKINQKLEVFEKRSAKKFDI